MVYKSTHKNNDNDNPLFNDIKFTVQNVWQCFLVMLIGMRIYIKVLEL